MFRGRAVAVVIPAFNEAGKIAATIRSVPAFVDHVIVVDDGSRDGTAAIARGAAGPGGEVIAHARNRGVGAAIATGYARALALGADATAVMAGDGQMDPADLPQPAGARRQRRGRLRQGQPVRVAGRVARDAAGAHRGQRRAVAADAARVRLLARVRFAVRLHGGVAAGAGGDRPGANVRALRLPERSAGAARGGGARVVDVPVRPVYGPAGARGCGRRASRCRSRACCCAGGGGASARDGARVAGVVVMNDRVAHDVVPAPRRRLRGLLRRRSRAAACWRRATRSTCWRRATRLRRRGATARDGKLSVTRVAAEPGAVLRQRRARGAGAGRRGGLAGGGALLGGARRGRARALRRLGRDRSALAGAVRAGGAGRRSRAPHRAYAHSGDVALLERMPLGRAIARRLARGRVDFRFVSDELRARFASLAGAAGPASAPSSRSRRRRRRRGRAGRAPIRRCGAAARARAPDRARGRAPGSDQGPRSVAARVRPPGRRAPSVRSRWSSGRRSRARAARPARGRARRQPAAAGLRRARRRRALAARRATSTCSRRSGSATDGRGGARSRPPRRAPSGYRCSSRAIRSRWLAAIAAHLRGGFTRPTPPCNRYARGAAQPRSALRSGRGHRAR